MSYVMRISDWSSDVCSSVLLHAHGFPARHAQQRLVDSTDRRAGSARGDLPYARSGRGRFALSRHHDFGGHPRSAKRRLVRHGVLAFVFLAVRRTRCAAVAQDIHDGGHGYDRKAGWFGFAQQYYTGRTLGARSEEHTSELQSLMRISYAVFCLKKKK